jgi:fluoride ion exporter CrcB/FEX
MDSKSSHLADSEAAQYDLEKKDQITSREGTEQKTESSGDTGAIPLSELTDQRPVDWDSSQQQNGPSLYSGHDREDNGAPLAELVSMPPVDREPSTTSRRGHPQPKRSSSPPSISNVATRIYIISYLIFFSILGTLARLGMQALTFYPGAPVVTGVLWANVGGSILMGFFLEDRSIFREEWGIGPDHSRDVMLGGDADAIAAWVKKHKTVKKTIPLYIGLTTGFCGSFTSFSSFMRDVFLALSNDLPVAGSSSTVDRGRGDSFMAVVAVILVTVTLSLSSLYFGAHLAVALDPWTPVLRFRLIRKVLDRVVVFLAWGCWLGAVFMAIWPPDRHRSTETWRGRAIFAIVFGPLGCLFRFYVSIWLNARVPIFPLGTFTVNIVGTAIEGMCYDLQHVANIGAGAGIASSSSLVGCQVLQGVMDGFCGCTTTVSTWVAELSSLGRRRHAYLYGSASVGIGLALLVVIMGSLRWTIGFASPVCT